VSAAAADRLEIRRLAGRLDLLPVLQRWFEAEWPGYYGPGGRGDAMADLASYANEGSLPLGLVALRGGEPCGFVALKADPFPAYAHRMPWVGAAIVRPELRRQGIGRALLLAVEPEARALGITRLHCATASAASLLGRCGWRLLDTVPHEGQAMEIFEKELR